jgi:hypothetical protein
MEVYLVTHSGPSAKPQTSDMEKTPTRELLFTEHRSDTE